MLCTHGHFHIQPNYIVEVVFWLCFVVVEVVTTRISGGLPSLLSHHAQNHSTVAGLVTIGGKPGGAKHTNSCKQMFIDFNNCQECQYIFTNLDKC